jgi:hypothetical protein
VHTSPRHQHHIISISKDRSTPHQYTTSKSSQPPKTGPVQTSSTHPPNHHTISISKYRYTTHQLIHSTTTQTYCSLGIHPPTSTLHQEKARQSLEEAEKEMERKKHAQGRIWTRHLSYLNHLQASSLTNSEKDGGNGELNPSLPVSTTDDNRTAGGGASGSRAREVQHAPILFDKTTTATATALLRHLQKEKVEPPCPWPPPPPHLSMWMCICVCYLRARTAAKAEDNELNNTGDGEDEELGDDWGWWGKGSEGGVVCCCPIRPSPALYHRPDIPASPSSDKFAFAVVFRLVLDGRKDNDKGGGGKGEFNDKTKYPFGISKRRKLNFPLAPLNILCREGRQRKWCASTEGGGDEMKNLGM